MASWNIQSLTSKYVTVSDVISSYNLDLLSLTESWHSSPSDVAVRRSAPPGYSFLDRPRQDPSDPDRRGGGIVVYHRSSLRVGRIELHSTPKTFEALALSVPFQRGPVTLLTVYRPGSSDPTTAFFSELATMLEQFALYNTQLMLVGDLNIHLQDPNDPDTRKFLGLLQQFGLAQHVAEPTHKQGGWLDVFITRDDAPPVDLEVHPPVPTISDHGLIVATVPFLRSGPARSIHYARAWRELDRVAFGAALRAALEPSKATDAMTLPSYSPSTNGLRTIY